MNRGWYTIYQPLKMVGEANGWGTLRTVLGAWISVRTMRWAHVSGCFHGLFVNLVNDTECEIREKNVKKPNKIRGF